MWSSEVVDAGHPHTRTFLVEDHAIFRQAWRPPCSKCMEVSKGAHGGQRYPPPASNAHFLLSVTPHCECCGRCGISEQLVRNLNRSAEMLVDRSDLWRASVNIRMRERLHVAAGKIMRTWCYFDLAPKPAKCPEKFDSFIALGGHGSKRTNIDESEPVPLAQRTRGCHASAHCIYTKTMSVVNTVR